MIRINLLPHREQKRQAKVRRFALFLGVFAVGGVAIAAAGALYLSQRIDSQNDRNAFMEEENRKLDRQLAEIETLKKERAELLARKSAVERLQSNRDEAVKIMDQLVRQTPEGIYLRDLKQSDNSITLVGFAQSSARVATLMRQLEDSPQFEAPQLVKIVSATANNQKVQQFDLTVKVTRQNTEGDAGAADSAAGKKKQKG